MEKEGYQRNRNKNKGDPYYTDISVNIVYTLEQNMTNNFTEAVIN